MFSFSRILPQAASVFAERYRPMSFRISIPPFTFTPWYLQFTAAFSPSSNFFGYNERSPIKLKPAKFDLTHFGGQAIHENVAEYVDYLQNPEKFTARGMKQPKGFIISGPSGVGKTILAEAIAGHAGVRLITVSASELKYTMVGNVKKNLQALFAQAKKMAPCVLCINEIDSLGHKRIYPIKTNADHYVNAVINLFLSLLSQDNPGVLVVGTTNNFSVLDSALVHPDRFNKHIYLSLPTLEDRIQILQIHTKDKELDKDITLALLAKLSSGYSGAKIVNWINQAVNVAARNQTKTLSLIHFEEARIIIEFGVRGIAQTDPIQKRQTALHEAAHAVVGHYLGKELYKISILKYDNVIGFVEWLEPEPDKQVTKYTFEDSIATTLAGRAAEDIRCLNTIDGCKNDLNIAGEQVIQGIIKNGLGSTLLGSDNSNEVEKILQKQLQRAKEILRNYRHTWHAIADVLMKCDQLNREDFLKMIEGKSLTQIPYFDKIKKITLPESKFSSITSSSLWVKPNKQEKEVMDKREFASAISIFSDDIESIVCDEKLGGVTIRFSLGEPKKDEYDYNKFDKIVHQLENLDITSLVVMDKNSQYPSINIPLKSMERLKALTTKDVNSSGSRFK